MGGVVDVSEEVDESDAAGAESSCARTGAVKQTVRAEARRSDFIVEDKKRAEAPWLHKKQHKNQRMPVAGQ